MADVKLYPDKHTWDMQGPNEDEPLQIWVRKERLLTFRNKYGEAKVLDKLDKPCKRPNDAEVEKMEKRLYTGLSSPTSQMSERRVSKALSLSCADLGLVKNCHFLACKKTTQ